MKAECSGRIVCSFFYRKNKEKKLNNKVSCILYLSTFLVFSDHKKLKQTHKVRIFMKNEHKRLVFFQETKTQETEIQSFSNGDHQVSSFFSLLSVATATSLKARNINGSER